MAEDAAAALFDRLKTLDLEMSLIGPDDLSTRAPGEHPLNFQGGVMALPHTVEAVSDLVRWCASEGIAIVPQGGRTGLVGGGISRPGELIISTAKLATIEAIHAAERTAVVQAGVTLQTLQEAAAGHGLTTGIDLPSRGTATIGGMVSTNAGGILAFRNGVMRHQVLGIEAVLPNGEIFSDLTRVVKVSAGPDLKHLFIGAEGALGIVTRVVVKLESRRTERATALIGVPNAQAALDIVGHFQARPEVLVEGAELMWRQFFRDAAGIFCFDAGWLEEETPAVLLLELSGESIERTMELFEAGLETLWEPLGLTGGIVAQSLDQARKFWQLREESEFIYRLHPAALSYDVSLPPSYLDTYVAEMRARLAAVDPAHSAYVYGHIADGNLHLSITNTANISAEQALEIEAAVYSGVREAAGSFSAEHGVGQEKRHAYETFGNPVKRLLARQIKAALDPNGLFNPGKVPF